VPALAPAVRPPAAAPSAPAPRPVPRHAPHLELVGPPASRRRLRTGPTFALGAVLAFAIAFAVVALQVVLVQGQQRLDQVNTEIAEQTDAYHQLRSDVAELEAPARIVAAATELGLVPPPEVVYLTPDGAITVPATATGPTDPGSGTGIDAPDAIADHAATRPNLEGGG
jgi:cell division protein FtsL